MSTDKGFILTVDKDMKNEAIKLFGKFCLNDKEFSVFSNDLFLDNSNICICLDKHIELEYYTIKHEYTQSIPNKYTFGLVSVWINENSKYTTFDFGPVTKSLFTVLNKSTELKQYFIEIIKKTNGYDFHIDNGDGSYDLIYSNRNID